ncbi:MAG TPA: exodeoxyribonuclease VII small subunit [Gemmatimonadaceae bacterium]|nr:exodeoxyribonuclease VII small subunit [Gemmatimonadaceae bacterium]
MSFESDLARLDAILAALERPDLELNAALALFEEGIERLRTAMQALDVADGRIRKLVEMADETFGLADTSG